MQIASVAGTFCTIAFDQAFPTPALFMVLRMLKIYAVGTIQQNRRGFPSIQIAEHHKQQPGGFKAFKKVGSAVHLCNACCIEGVWIALLAVQWFDKNVVNMLSSKHGDDMKQYMYKAKGEVDQQESLQPETREEYNDTNNGVDLVDQHNSATINPHGSKLTIWHRMHDHYLNQAAHQAVTHYLLVIAEHGDDEQKNRTLGKKGGDGVRRGGKRTDDLFWELMHQLAENAQFGSDSNPQLTNLRAGRPQLISSKTAQGQKRTRRCVSDDESDDDETMPTAPTHVERRQGEACEICFLEAPAMCCYCPSNKATIGCKTCGVRFCSGSKSDSPFACLNAHLKGAKCTRVPRVGIKWWAPDEEEE